MTRLVIETTALYVVVVVSAIAVDGMDRRSHDTIRFTAVDIAYIIDARHLCHLAIAVTILLVEARDDVSGLSRCFLRCACVGIRILSVIIPPPVIAGS